MQFTALSIALALGLSSLSIGTNSAPAPVTSQPKQSTKAASLTQQVLAEKIVVVEAGDTLTQIAERENTTVERLFFANTGIQRPDIINPGDQLRIPRAEESLVAREIPAAPAPVAVVAPAPSQASASPRSSSAPVAAGGSVWDQLATCEAGGNWAINTGNGYYGGLQFNLSSWQAVGGTGLPSDASRDEQIMRGQMLQARQGWGAWPSCSSKLGLL